MVAVCSEFSGNVIFPEISGNTGISYSMESYNIYNFHSNSQILLGAMVNTMAKYKLFF